MAPFVPSGLFARWRFAAKVASWPKLLVPTLFGHALGTRYARFDPIALVLGSVFTIFTLLFVVFLNDYADREVDALKRRMFPDTSSPKTIPDGVLSATHLRWAGMASATLASAVAAVSELWLHRSGLWLAGTLSLGVFAAYSLPPIRLNYRGGGELLEMLGVGAALPVLHAYWQSGDAHAGFSPLLAGSLCLALASAVASGLADERSDRRGGKRTYVTAFGNPAARRLIELLTFLGALDWLLLGAVGPMPLWIVGPAAATVLFFSSMLLPRSAAATTDSFAAQRAYKSALHSAIWFGTTTLSALLAIRHYYGLSEQ